MPRSSYSKDGPQENVLLVEGLDDLHFFQHLFNHHRLEKCCQIVPKEGYEDLRGSLKERLLQSDLKRLGIVVDADSDVNSRWASLRDKLYECEFTKAKISVVPNVGGTVITQLDLPTVGIWIMPDNQSSGMIEDFAKSLIPSDDFLLSHARNSINAIPEEQMRFSNVAYPKALIHTWLAWQAEPRQPMGLAIKEKYLNADAPPAQILIAWIRRLFELDLPTPAPTSIRPST